MTFALQPHYPLQALNTFGIAARADFFAELDALADLPDLLATPQAQQGPVVWLGGGSNLLLTGDVAGLVVRMALKGIRLLKEEHDSVIVEAAAGENWHSFVRHTLEAGWYGLENLSLIPGTVGASPVQNIGAYGVEVKDCIEEVVTAELDHGGRERILTNAECRFGYRDSVFKHEAAGRLLVTAVRFKLSRTPRLITAYGDIDGELSRMGISHPTPLDVSAAVMRIRSSKLPDPAKLGNAGSFFKNPIVDSDVAEALLQRYPKLVNYPAGAGKTKLAAGWMIDQAGLKGYRDGDAAVHERQALVLVNHGSASGADIVRLAEHIRSVVRERYGVELECEPVVL